MEEGRRKIGREGEYEFPFKKGDTVLFELANRKYLFAKINYFVIRYIRFSKPYILESPVNIGGEEVPRVRKFSDGIGQWRSHIIGLDNIVKHLEQHSTLSCHVGWIRDPDARPTTLMLPKQVDPSEKNTD